MAKTLTGSKQLISQSVVGAVNGYNVYLRMYAMETNTNPSTNKGDITCYLYVYYDAPSSAHTFFTQTGVISTVDFAGQFPFVSESLGAITFTGKQEVLILAKTKSLTHNSDGNYSSTMKGNVTIYYEDISGSTSQTVNCVTIPRYTTITKFTVATKNEGAVTINWATADTIDIVYFKYRKSGESDYSPYLYRNVADGTSGTFSIETEEEFEIKGSDDYHIVQLDPNSTYWFVLQVRRKDSKQITTSNAVSGKTDKVPYCTSAPNFTIGDNVTIGLYNPYKRENTIDIKVGNTTIYSITTTGTSFNFNSTTYNNALLSQLGNYSISRQYSVVVHYNWYDFIDTTTNATYTVSSASNPVLNSGTVVDINSTTTNITGNNNFIIKGYSIARISIDDSDYEVGDAYTQYKSMTVIGYGSTTGKQYDIANPQVKAYKIFIENSRALKSNSIIVSALSLIDYKPLTLSAKFDRPTEVSDQMTLEVSGDYFDGNFANNPNTLTIRWRVSIDNNNWSDYYTLVQGTDYTINNNRYSGYNISLTNPFYYKTRDEYFKSGVTYYTEQDGVYTVYPSSSYNVGDPIPSSPTLYLTGTWDYLTQYYFEVEAKDLLETKTVRQTVKIGQPFFSWWRDSYNDVNYFAVNGKLNYGANGREDYDPAGFIYDQYGNMKHKRSTTSDNWSIQDSSGNNAVRVYPETKYVNVYGGLETNSNITIKNASYLKGIDASNNSINLIRATGNRCAIGDSTKETRLWSSVIPTVEFGGTVYNIQLSPVSLYDNSSGSNGTITLSQTVANFNRIEISFRTNDSNSYVSSVMIYSPNGKFTSLIYNLVASSGTDFYIKSRNIYINGTSISTQNTRYSEYRGSNSAITVANYIYITKVNGYK